MKLAVVYKLFTYEKEQQFVYKLQASHALDNNSIDKFLAIHKGQCPCKSPISRHNWLFLRAS